MQFQPQQRCITVIAQVPGSYGFKPMPSDSASLFTAINPGTCAITINMILCNSCNFRQLLIFLS